MLYILIVHVYLLPIVATYTPTVAAFALLATALGQKTD